VLGERGGDDARGGRGVGWRCGTKREAARSHPRAR
jgi:hypothetical protein